MSGRAGPRYRRAALVGTGHIGGSLLLALRTARVVERAVGYDRERAHAEEALGRGIVDEIAPSAAAVVAGADLVVLATPVRATSSVAAEMGPALPEAALVIDVGSTKARVAAAVERVLARAGRPARFVPCHPIAGSERSGPAAADAALLAGRLALITPTASTLPEAAEEAAALFVAAGCRVLRLDPALHDAVLGAVSHLPHVASFALAAAVDRILDGDPAVAGAASGLAGGGFADTTRIAASDPVMWRDVFLENRERLLGYVDALAAEVAALRAAIAAGDGEAIAELVLRARRGRARVMRP